jgi:thioredoxin-like negative regulator of GroEL
MTGLLFLQSNDFRLVNGLKGTIMVTQLKGISIVVFYSSQCIHCKKLLPLFKNLSSKIQGCQFGIVNVGNSKECILLSRSTKNPINVVPYIILYINGRPYMRYQGPHTETDIANFIIEVTKQTHIDEKNNKNNLAEKTNPRLSKHSNSKQIPAYCLGNPVIGDGEDVCYLEFDGAYGDL